MTNPLITLYFLAALQWAGNPAPSGTEPRLADDNGDGTIGKSLSRMTAARSHPLARVDSRSRFSGDLWSGIGRRKAQTESSHAFAAENLSMDRNSESGAGNAGETSPPEPNQGKPIKHIPADWLQRQPRR